MVDGSWLVSFSCCCCVWVKLILWLRFGVDNVVGICGMWVLFIIIFVCDCVGFNGCCDGNVGW